MATRHVSALDYLRRREVRNLRERQCQRLLSALLSPSSKTFCFSVSTLQQLVVLVRTERERQTIVEDALADIVKEQPEFLDFVRGKRLPAEVQDEKAREIGRLMVAISGLDNPTLHQWVVDLDS